MFCLNSRVLCLLGLQPSPIVAFVVVFNLAFNEWPVKLHTDTQKGEGRGKEGETERKKKRSIGMRDKF